MANPHPAPDRVASPHPPPDRDIIPCPTTEKVATPRPTCLFDDNGILYPSAELEEFSLLHYGTIGKPAMSTGHRLLSTSGGRLEIGGIRLCRSAVCTSLLTAAEGRVRAAVKQASHIPTVSGLPGGVRRAPRHPG